MLTEPFFLSRVTVNCGMLFVIAAIKGDGWNFDFEYSDEPSIAIRQYIAYETNELYNYSYNFTQGATISLLLTVANVIMVAVGAALMFRTKE